MFSAIKRIGTRVHSLYDEIVEKIESVVEPEFHRVRAEVSDLREDLRLAQDRITALEKSIEDGIEKDIAKWFANGGPKADPGNSQAISATVEHVPATT